MDTKLKEALFFIIVLFVAGVSAAMAGLLSGPDMAAAFSRPAGAMAWTTSENVTQAFTWVPVIVGSLMMLSASLMGSTLFRHWLDKRA